jgi:hypothetical protein
MIRICLVVVFLQLKAGSIYSNQHVLCIKKSAEQKSFPSFLQNDVFSLMLSLHVSNVNKCINK